METIKEEQKILVKYLREKDTYEAKLCKDKNGKMFAHLEKQKGKIIGCIISVNKNVIGWSLINKLDRQWIDSETITDQLYDTLSYEEVKLINKKPIWNNLNPKQQEEILAKNKELAFHIAYHRAIYADVLSKEDLFHYYSKIPDSILEEVDKMLERSEKYFVK